MVLILLGGGWAVMLRKEKTSELVPTGPDTSDLSYVNLRPPTEEETKQAEDNKEEIIRRENNNPPPAPTPSGKKQVTPIITSANHNEVRAYVPGIFEEGGTCTATATKGTTTVAATSEGFQNSNYTSCAPINFVSPLNGNGWSIVVNYSSSASEGKSKEFIVE